MFFVGTEHRDGCNWYSLTLCTEDAMLFWDVAYCDYTEHKCRVSRTVLYEREHAAYDTSTLNELTTGLWISTGESIKGEI